MVKLAVTLTADEVFCKNGVSLHFMEYALALALTHVHAYARIHEKKCTFAYIYSQVCAYAHFLTRTFTHTRTHARMYAHFHAHIHGHIHTCTQNFTHGHSHVYLFITTTRISRHPHVYLFITTTRISRPY